MTISRGAPLAALALALALSADARAGLGGLCGGCAHGSACGDGQSQFAACGNQLQPTYKVVYDTVHEKRFHVCYETVRETVLKRVAKTCYRTECQTAYRPCHSIEHRTVQ